MGIDRIAVVGIGATGSILAAALLKKHPETVLVGRDPEVGQVLLSRGIRVSGAINCQTSVQNYITQIKKLNDYHPDLIFLATKTFHLAPILRELKEVLRPGMMLISTQNGLGPEDFIADKIGPDSVFRMSLNFGASMKKVGQCETAFFNAPNHLGGLLPDNKDLGIAIATMLTECGLDTEFVEDIKLYVWKKMVMKCTMASICAVTDKTIKEALEFAPTREIANACFKEALAVAQAVGYDIGEDYLDQAVNYLKKAGIHRDSMCIDIQNKAPTEIDFLGGKVVNYARRQGIATPYFVALTNLVKAIEDNYLKHGPK